MEVLGFDIESKGEELSDAEVVATAIRVSSHIVASELQDKPAARFLSEEDVRLLAKRMSKADAETRKEHLKRIADKARELRAHFPKAADVLAVSTDGVTERADSAHRRY